MSSLTPTRWDGQENTCLHSFVKYSIVRFWSFTVSTLGTLEGAEWWSCLGLQSKPLEASRRSFTVDRYAETADTAAAVQWSIEPKQLSHQEVPKGVDQIKWNLVVIIGLQDAEKWDKWEMNWNTLDVYHWLPQAEFFELREQAALATAIQ